MTRTNASQVPVFFGENIVEESNIIDNLGQVNLASELHSSYLAAAVTEK